MSEKKYVELQHVQELLKLIKTRDRFHDWSTDYEKYDKKVKNTIEWLERNASTVDEVARYNATVTYIGEIPKKPRIEESECDKWVCTCHL